MKFSDRSRNKYTRGPSQLSTLLYFQLILPIYAATNGWVGASKLNLSQGAGNPRYATGNNISIITWIYTITIIFSAKFQSRVWKDTKSFFLGGRISVGAGKFLWVRRILPEFSRKKFRPPKRSSSCYFERRWAPFLLIFSGFFCSDFQGFCESFQRFCPDFHEFCPNFEGFFPGFSPNQNFCGCACTLCTPTFYTSGWTNAFWWRVPLSETFLVSLWPICRDLVQSYFVE